MNKELEIKIVEAERNIYEHKAKYGRVGFAEKMSFEWDNVIRYLYDQDLKVLAQLSDTPPHLLIEYIKR